MIHSYQREGKRMKYFYFVAWQGPPVALPEKLGQKGKALFALGNIEMISDKPIDSFERVRDVSRSIAQEHGLQEGQVMILNFQLLRKEK